MFDLKNEKAFIYRIALPAMQVLACVAMLFALIFDDKLESISDILRNISIVMQFLVLVILGAKELAIKENKIGAYLYFGFLFIMLIFIVYIISI